MMNGTWSNLGFAFRRCSVFRSLAFRNVSRGSVPLPFAFALVTLPTLFSGCSGWQKTHEAALTAWSAGDLETSTSKLDASQSSMRAEKEMLELDQSILQLAAGEPAQAETRLRRVRDELEHLAQKDVTEQATSMMTDSRAVAYAGRDFERQMLLNMLMISSVLNDGQDAFAYSLQASEKTYERREAIASAAKKLKDEAIAAKPPADSTSGIARVSFPGTVELSETADSRVVEIPASPLDQPLALSSYLTAMVQSESSSRSSEVETALQEVKYWNPKFEQLVNGARGDMGIRCQRGNGSLHIIALVGQAPRWVSESAEPTSAALLIADRIISATGKHTLPPTIASVKIARPERVFQGVPVTALRSSVSAPDQPGTVVAAANFSTLVDLNEVAEASYREHRDDEIAAVIIRRVMKKGTVYVLKETQGIHNNTWVDLGVNAAGVVWEAMEKPDTRSWRTLPARIDVSRCELPQGDWTVQVSLSQYGSPQSISVPAHIEDGRNTCVVCLIPDRSFAGHVLVGGADRAKIPVKP
jgi:hypothetical protein